MFNTARLKLTVWYLFVIMLISIFFSLAIYRILTNELERGFKRVSAKSAEDRQRFFARPRLLDPGYLEEAEDRIKFMLIYINIVILGASGTAGYFLAGKTLLSIKIMLDDQNRFIADSSHELRTPLTSLKTSIEVYLRSKKPTLKDANELIRLNLKEVDSLQVLSNNLLALAQYEKGRINSPVGTVAIDKAAEEALERVTPLAKQKKINLKNECKACYVKADYPNIVQLFIIFLDNAIKYNPKNTTVTITAQKEDNLVRISIADNGIGMEDTDLFHIFDRFYRADASRTKQNVKGYGLGLAIAKRIIEIYGGNIQAESETDKGTTFYIKFPSAKKV